MFFLVSKATTAQNYAKPISHFSNASTTDSIRAPEKKYYASVENSAAIKSLQLGCFSAMLELVLQTIKDITWQTLGSFLKEGTN